MLGAAGIHLDGLRILRHDKVDQRVSSRQTLGAPQVVCVFVRRISKLPGQGGSLVRQIQLEFGRARYCWVTSISIIENHIVAVAQGADVMLKTGPVKWVSDELEAAVRSAEPPNHIARIAIDFGNLAQMPRGDQNVS